MKKKGFTLVELLATIVVLSVIALIATPIIINVIEKAKKGALVSSVNGLVESANMYYTNEIIKGDIIGDVIFDFEEGMQTSDNKLSYKGKVYNGKLILTSDSDVITCIDDGKYYAYKEKDSDEVISGIGTCVYDGTTGDFTIESDTELLKCEEDKDKLQEQINNLTTTVNNLQTTINEKEYEISNLNSIIEGLNNELTILNGEKEELLKQIENSNLGNNELQNKITELEGIIDTLESSIEAKNNEITVLNGEKTELQNQLTAKTNELKTLNENLGKVTASASDVLSGKTILTSSGLVTGSMTNNGSITQALNAGGSYTIPKGYHDGTGKVTANSLASQTKVDSGKTAITASQVLTGYQGWVNGSKVTGTMANKAGTTTTVSSITESGDNAIITIPANGYYSTSSKISVPIEKIKNEVSSLKGAKTLLLLYDSQLYNGQSGIVYKTWNAAGGSASYNNGIISANGTSKTNSTGGLAQRTVYALENAIELTEWDIAVMHVASASGTGSIKVAIFADPFSSNYNTAFVSGNTISSSSGGYSFVDISSLNGNYYVGAWLQSSASSNAVYSFAANVDKILLIKYE